MSEGKGFTRAEGHVSGVQADQFSKTDIEQKYKGQDLFELHIERTRKLYKEMNINNPECYVFSTTIYGKEALQNDGSTSDS